MHQKRLTTLQEQWFRMPCNGTRTTWKGRQRKWQLSRSFVRTKPVTEKRLVEYMLCTRDRGKCPPLRRSFPVVLLSLDRKPRSPGILPPGKRTYLEEKTRAVQFSMRELKFSYILSSAFGRGVASRVRRIIYPARNAT